VVDTEIHLPGVYNENATGSKIGKNPGPIHFKTTELCPFLPHTDSPVLTPQPLPMLINRDRWSHHSNILPHTPLILMVQLEPSCQNSTPYYGQEDYVTGR